MQFQKLLLLLPAMALGVASLPTKARAVELGGETNQLYNGIFADLDKREEVGPETDIVYPIILADLDQRAAVGPETDIVYPIIEADLDRRAA